MGNEPKVLRCACGKYYVDGVGCSDCRYNMRYLSHKLKKESRRNKRIGSSFIMRWIFN
jgi:hypothetical protein